MKTKALSLSLSLSLSGEREEEEGERERERESRFCAHRVARYMYLPNLSLSACVCARVFLSRFFVTIFVSFFSFRDL